MAVDKWRSYLLGEEFILRTDYRSLLHLTEQSETSRIQQKALLKALLKLMDLQYKIQYKKGANNTAVDAVSRVHGSEELFSISLSNPTWLERLQQGYEEDEISK
jgi:hypothetical protein